MAQQTIGVGTVANDNTGDPIRDAFIKVNANFDELFTITGDDSNLRSTDDGTDQTVTTNLTNGNLILVGNGTGQVVLSGSTTRLTTATATPATSTGAVGDTLGDYQFDTSYLYICVKDYDAGIDTWKRVALTTF